MYEFPLTTLRDRTYRLRLDRVNGNLALFVVAVDQPKLLGGLSKGFSNQPLLPNECLIRESLPPLLQEIVDTLVEQEILVQSGDVTPLFQVSPPKVVRVFHNQNARFKVKADPDCCTNLIYVATVSVPKDEDPLNWAFTATNHIDSDWTKNAGVIATPVERGHRSTSVGDVMELIGYQTSPVRYIVASFGFDLV